MTTHELVKAVALDGRVTIELPEPQAYGVGLDGRRGWASVTLTAEQAGEAWNAIAEAQLVALEQRVRARRRVTEGARGGWATAPAQGRHAVTEYAGGFDVSGDLLGIPSSPPDVSMALAESTASAVRILEAAARARAAAPEPGDPYPAPDYQHPDDDE